MSQRVNISHCRVAHPSLAYSVKLKYFGRALQYVTVQTQARNRQG